MSGGRRIAIIGFGETAKDCPHADPSWELWAMNGWLRVAAERGVPAPPERYSRWFDMHTPEYTERYGVEANIGDAQVKWLETKQPFPIFMLDHYDRFPSSVRFPIEDVIAAVGVDYFTSTVAYALAYALSLEDVAEVGLWGIDLVHETEYGDQRPCAEYYIGRLQGRGVKVTIHKDSALLRQRHRYGYEDENPLYQEMRKSFSEHHASASKRLAELREQLEKIHAEMHVNDAALQTISFHGERMEVWRRGGRM